MGKFFTVLKIAFQMAPVISCLILWNSSKRWWPSFRQQQQNTPTAVKNRDTVTIIVPVHPFFNRQLVVVRNEREQKSGRRYVVVEHPAGGLLRLPIEWTDQSAPQFAQRINGRELQLDLKRLQKLHQMCAVALGDRLDSDHSGRTITKPKREIQQRNGICGDNVVISIEDAEDTNRRCVGNIGAQTTSESST